MYDNPGKIVFGREPLHQVALVDSVANEGDNA
jgi:hypothetical protein